MPLALFLAGCSGTLQTRSATPHDTFFRWKPQMETLPIEVHGGIERLGPDDIARQIPHGTTALQYARAADGQGKLATIPRIVLYVDSEQGLVSETYCDTSQAVQSVTTDGVESHVVAALCDGPRLIDSTTRDVRNASIQSDGMASIVKSMKRRLLYGLSAGDHVVPAEYGNG
ncbi:MAG TPA: hypothetical protein VL997_00160 [Dyella sp.]|nr:hypothetical protein [Dyella sp.]